MNFVKASAYFEPSVKKFLIALVMVLHPFWLNAAEPWVYVSNNRSDSMTIINTATDEVITTLPVGKEPHVYFLWARIKTPFVLGELLKPVSLTSSKFTNPAF